MNKEYIKFSYELDKFQIEGCNTIANNENLLVTAHTGSGKTVLALYAIAKCLTEGKKVVYTSPIKTLSNQKFAEFSDQLIKSGQFPDKTIGIMTGDIRYAPNADVVVMTTEILRNLLYKKGSATEHLGLTASLSLENLDAVIFDECHYINNKERGSVWEETMILLPNQTNLVLLSATIDSAELFASWLGELKQKPIHLISTTYRIVPLEHYVIKKDTYETIMDAKEVFYGDAYNRWTSWKRDQEKNQKQQKQQKQQQRQQQRQQFKSILIHQH